jgi:hypothetical protein
MEQFRTSEPGPLQENKTLRIFNCASLANASLWSVPQASATVSSAHSLTCPVS